MRYILFIFILLFLGCTPKTVVQKVYVDKELPILRLFEAPEAFDFGSVYNKGDLICFVDWSNKCLPKSKFLDLFEHLIDLNTVIKNYRVQIELYEANRLEVKK